MKDSLWRIDLLRCESILLKTHWVLVVMDQLSRRIIGFGVHVGDVDGVASCRMFNSAISTMGMPRYLSSDNEPLFEYHRWQANLRILEIDEIKSVPYTPTSQISKAITTFTALAALWAVTRLLKQLGVPIDFLLSWIPSVGRSTVRDFISYPSRLECDFARDRLLRGGLLEHDRCVRLFDRLKKRGRTL